MTEALIRGLNFTGVDINPLAALVCEAKIAVESNLQIEVAAQEVVRACRFDPANEVDVSFPNINKWFDESTAARLSAIRRAIQRIPQHGARKILWTVFAETIRKSSNSRTSTYKLHVRPPGERVCSENVRRLFEENVRSTLNRIAAYRMLISERPKKNSVVRIICEDVRTAEIGPIRDDHVVLVTSPPYGDNQTTIPYGQFSYLAMCWIPQEDLHPSAQAMIRNTHFLDSASLGGSLRGAVDKAEKIAAISSTFAQLLERAGEEKVLGLRKVSVFLADLSDAFSRARTSCPGSAHWVITTANRTARGVEVPLDKICREMIIRLGGSPVTTLRRQLRGKRMPFRNSIADLMATETTLVAEFA